MRIRSGKIVLGGGLLVVAIINLVSFANAKVNFNLAVTQDNTTLEVTLRDGNGAEIGSEGVTMTVTPTSGNTVFGTEDISATVVTDSAFGYKLFLKADNSDIISNNNIFASNIASTDLVDNSGETIPTLGQGTYTCTAATSNNCNFTVNSWGYRLSTDPENTFRAVPGADEKILQSWHSTEGDTITTQFGSRVDYTQVVGVYETELDYVAVANASRIGISDLTYMQDFSALSNSEVEDVKNSMSENASYQLVDKRDNKKYWITKLQTAATNPRVTASGDGKKYQIWMTQNLDLDLETAPTNVAALNSNNTDINSSTGIYTSGYSTDNGVITWTPIRETANSISQYAINNTTPYSYNPGNIYYYRDTSSSSSTCNTAEVCNHWHAGNYYNWNAVVASNDTSAQTTDYTEASNSICPKGWKMPVGLTSASGYSDFNYLLVQNNIATSYVGAGANATWASSGFSNIQASPLFITATGNISSNTGSLSNTNTYGQLWTGTSANSTKSYYLVFGSSIVYPAGYGDTRAGGMQVRCIVRQ